MTRKKNNMRITFWGVRGSVPAPGRDFVNYGGNTSCVEVRCGDTILIFDAGTGIKNLGISLADEFRNTSLDVNIFISHTHWDHIQGFPFFIPLYGKNSRINIYGGHFYSDIKSLLSRQMEKEFFPVAINEVPSTLIFHNIDENPITIQDIAIYHTHLLHPALSLGFRVEYQNKVFVYATDNELIIDDELPNFNEKNINHLYENADLLVADCQYTADEYPIKIGWGHSSIEEVIKATRKFGVKKLMLFHHDPYHSDSMLDSMLDHAIRIADKNVSVDAAKEGMSIDL